MPTEEQINDTDLDVINAAGKYDLPYFYCRGNIVGNEMEVFYSLKDNPSELTQLIASLILDVKSLRKVFAISVGAAIADMEEKEQKEFYELIIKALDIFSTDETVKWEYFNQNGEGDRE